MLKDDLISLGYNPPESIATGSNTALPIGGGRGVCASFYSPDELDRRALAFAEDIVGGVDSDGLRALDLGCSPYFPMAARLARLGLTVDAFDIELPVREFPRINERLDNRVNYLVRDLSDSRQKTLSRKYLLLYANRLLSHLRFEDARRILREFSDASVAGSRLFFSLSSLESDLADNYPHVSKPVAERYAAVQNERTTENRIFMPMCLYGDEDVTHLLAGTKFVVMKQFKSPSGSIKVVAKA